MSSDLCNEVVESRREEPFLKYLDICHLEAYFDKFFSKFDLLHPRPPDAVKRVEYLLAKMSKHGFIPD